MEVKLALAQYPITKFASFEDWKIHVVEWVERAVSGGAKIIVFPEYGSMELTSLLSDEKLYDLQAQLYALQELLEDFLKHYSSLAVAFDCVIVAPSFPEFVNKKFVNRAYVFSSNWISYQDKHFMTRFEDEIWGISTSDGIQRVFETKYGKFGIQICFDVEFPIGAQLLAHAGVDFVVVPSCTETKQGAARVHIGARARALEQQLYVGISQTVNDALWSEAVDINYGYAAVYSSPDNGLPNEGIVAQQEPQKEGWLFVNLDFSKNNSIRQDGQVLNYKWSYSFEIISTMKVETVKL